MYFFLGVFVHGCYENKDYFGSFVCLYAVLQSGKCNNLRLICVFMLTFVIQIHEYKTARVAVLFCEILTQSVTVQTRVTVRFHSCACPTGHSALQLNIYSHVW